MHEFRKTKMRIEHSDLNGPTRQTASIVHLFQPLLTISDCDSVAEDRHLRDYNWLSKVFDASFHLSGLVHVGSFHFDTNVGETGGPFAMHPRCAGNVKIVPVNQTSNLKHETNGLSEVLVCNRCGLEIASRSYPNIESLKNLFFHLMVKQVVPKLPALNFINCAARQRYLVSGDLKQLQALGLVSVAFDEFVGMVPEQPPAHTFLRACSLGYLFMPGMQTLGDCGKFMPWLQFLTIMRLRLLVKQQQLAKSLILGPKRL